MLVDLFKLFFKPGDFIEDDSSVGFDLCFAGAAQADAAPLPFEVGPHSGQPWQQVLILCKLNLGSGMEISIKDLTELIARLTGFNGQIIWDSSKPNGQPRRRLDVARAEREFGFKAEVSFEEGLKRTIDWYRNEKGTQTRP